MKRITEKKSSYLSDYVSCIIICIKTYCAFQNLFLKIEKKTFKPYNRSFNTSERITHYDLLKKY